MTNSFKRAGYIFCLFIVGILAGCVPIKGDLPVDYHFKPDTTEGLAILSIACDLGEGDSSANLFLNKKEPSDNDPQLYRVIVNCGAGGSLADRLFNEKAGKPALKILNLSEGTYYFNSIMQNIGEKIVTVKFNPLYFKVLPQQVSYLGRLKIAPDNNEVRFGLIDAENQDIPWAKQKLLFLNKEKIKINYLSKSN